MFDTFPHISKFPQVSDRCTACGVSHEPFSNGHAELLAADSEGEFAILARMIGEIKNAETNGEALSILMKFRHDTRMSAIRLTEREHGIKVCVN